jgi:hypothetical protein
MLKLRMYYLPDRAVPSCTDARRPGRANTLSREAAVATIRELGVNDGRTS